LKNKKHWNSFTSSYFLNPEEVLHKLKTSGKFSPPDSDQAKGGQKHGADLFYITFLSFICTSPHYLGSWVSIGILFRVKSWIQIRIKIRIQEH
jgi:hypothetical protein